MNIALFNDFPVLVGALLKSIVVSGLQLVAFLGVFVVIGFLIHRMEVSRNTWLQQSVGVKGIYATAWIGVPVHEMGHALMCWLFGHKVEQIKLVQFGAPDGTMGYVNHTYDPSNLFHRIGLFFIGIAPIIMGIAVIAGTLYFTLPETFGLWIEAVKGSYAVKDIGDTSWLLVRSLFSVSNFTNPLFYLFLVISVSVASHMSLSKADIAGAKSGLVSMYVILVILNLLLLSHSGGDMKIKELFLNNYNVFVLSVSVIAILFSGLASAFAYGIHKAVSKR